MYFNHSLCGWLHMTWLASTCFWTSLFCCHTFPWTSESSRLFPGRQPVFAPLLCSYRSSHSERTLLLAPRPPSRRWPGPIWAPRVPSAGHQLWQRANRRISGQLSSWRWAVSCSFPACLPLPLPQSSLSQTCHSRPSLSGVFLSWSRARGWSSKTWKRCSLSDRAAQFSTCEHTQTYCKLSVSVWLGDDET